MRVDLPIPSENARPAADPWTGRKTGCARRGGSANLTSGQGTRLHRAIRSASVHSPKKGRSTESPERSPHRSIFCFMSDLQRSGLDQPLCNKVLIDPSRCSVTLSEQKKNKSEVSPCRSNAYSSPCWRQSSSLHAGAFLARNRRSGWPRAEHQLLSSKRTQCLARRAISLPTAWPFAANSRRAADAADTVFEQAQSHDRQKKVTKCEKRGTFLTNRSFGITIDLRATARNREDISCVFLPLPLWRLRHLVLQLAKAPTLSAASLVPALAQQQHRRLAATSRAQRLLVAQPASFATMSRRNSAAEPFSRAQLTRTPDRNVNAVRTEGSGRRFPFEIFVSVGTSEQRDRNV